ncbi:hypothetical protein V2J09_013767 [Rumex salicifolius]
MPCNRFKHPNCQHFIVFILLFYVINQVNSLEFNYTNFPDYEYGTKFFKFNGESYAALHVTRANFSGRVINKEPFKLGSFNTTFVFGNNPQSDPAGEGLAFILTKDLHFIPDNSYGQWLGIVNKTMNGTSTNYPIVAVEFDTKKSYDDDLDDSHVGVDINTIYSMKQEPMKSVNMSGGTEITAMIKYDGIEKWLKVFVFYRNDTSGPNTKVPVISIPLNLSNYLPETVFFGFSASTGTNMELNCIKAWSFSGDDVDSPIPKWVWIVSPLCGGVLMLAIVGCVYWRIKNSRENLEREPSIEDAIEISNIGPKKYKLKELKSATGNFNAKNELGRGGFGIVYKGKLKGEEVAVKRIRNNNKQGRKNMIAEVTTIGSVHHKNVVKLKGWCYEGDKLLLVYDYMPNGSLDKLLYPKGRLTQSTLSWKRRYKIVCGVAQSLDYLHNECSKRVLHRDIKTSNIMLDSDDVYAFGVLALEVICGRKPGTHTPDGELSNSIVEWAWELYRLDMICSAIDPKLKENYNVDEV